MNIRAHFSFILIAVSVLVSGSCLAGTNDQGSGPTCNLIVLGQRGSQEADSWIERFDAVLGFIEQHLQGQPTLENHRTEISNLIHEAELSGPLQTHEVLPFAVRQHVPLLKASDVQHFYSSGILGVLDILRAEQTMLKRTLERISPLGINSGNISVLRDLNRKVRVPVSGELQGDEKRLYKFRQIVVAFLKSKRTCCGRGCFQCFSNFELKTRSHPLLLNAKAGLTEEELAQEISPDINSTLRTEILKANNLKRRQALEEFSSISGPLTRLEQIQLKMNALGIPVASDRIPSLYAPPPLE